MLLWDPLIGNLFCEVVTNFAFVRTPRLRKHFCTLWTPPALKCTFNIGNPDPRFSRSVVRNDGRDSERNGSRWCRALPHLVLLIVITRHFFKPRDKNVAAASSNSQQRFTTLVILTALQYDCIFAGWLLSLGSVHRWTPYVSYHMIIQNQSDSEKI